MPANIYHSIFLFLKMFVFIIILIDKAVKIIFFSLNCHTSTVYYLINKYKMKTRNLESFELWQLKLISPLIEVDNCHKMKNEKGIFIFKVDI